MAERPASTILSVDSAIPSSGAPGDGDRYAAVVRRFGGRIESVDPTEPTEHDGASSWSGVRPPPPRTTPSAPCGPGSSWSWPGWRPGSAWPPTTRTGPAARARPRRSGEVWVDRAGAVPDLGRHRLHRPGTARAARRAGAGSAVPRRCRRRRRRRRGPAEHVWVPLVGYERELAQIKDTLHAAVEDVGRSAARGRRARPAPARPGWAPSWSTTSTAWPAGSGGSGDAPRRTASATLVLGARRRAARPDRRQRQGRPGRRCGASSNGRTAGAGHHRATSGERLTERLLALLVGDAWRTGGPAQELVRRPGCSGSSTSARTEPVVWVLDDAHLADDGLVAFVDHVVRRAASPVLRPGPRPARGHRPGSRPSARPSGRRRSGSTASPRRGNGERWRLPCRGAEPGGPGAAGPRPPPGSRSTRSSRPATWPTAARSSTGTAPTCRRRVVAARPGPAAGAGRTGSLPGGRRCSAAELRPLEVPGRRRPVRTREPSPRPWPGWPTATWSPGSATRCSPTSASHAFVAAAGPRGGLRATSAGRPGPPARAGGRA